GVGGVVAVVGVGPNVEVAGPDGVGPSEEGVELGRRVGRGEGDLAGDDGAAGAVEGQPVAFGDGDVADGDLAVTEAEGFGADHGGLAPAAGDDRRVADQAATGGEDALGGQHAVDVLGGGLATD